MSKNFCNIALTYFTFVATQDSLVYTSTFTSSKPAQNSEHLVPFLNKTLFPIFMFLLNVLYMKEKQSLRINNRF